MEKDTVKALLSFNPKFLGDMDKHWRSQNFSNRSEYIKHLVRKDMENVQMHQMQQSNG